MSFTIPNVHNHTARLTRLVILWISHSNVSMNSVSGQQSKLITDSIKESNLTVKTSVMLISYLYVTL